MSTATLSTHAAIFDDRIEKALPTCQEGNFNLRILELNISKIQTTMDCDSHPSCDCYSQCHAIVW